SSDIFATRMGPDVGASLPGDHNTASGSPQVDWAQHQFSTNLDASTFDPFLPPVFGRVLVGLTTTEIGVLLQAGGQLKKLVGDAVTGKPLSDLLTELFEIVGLTVIDSAENMAITAVDLGIQMLVAIRDMMNGRWDVPVLTALYEEIICKGDGSKLSLLDLASLLATIPATVLGKRALDHNLFSKAQIDAIDNAHDWDTAMRALSVAAPKARLAALGAEATLQQQAAQALQLVSGVLRLVTSRLSFAKDIVDVSTDDPGLRAKATSLLGRPKLVCDWILYTVGLVGASLLQPEHGTDRQNVDLAITIAGFVPLALDTARQVRGILAAGNGGPGITLELDHPDDGQPLPPGPGPDPDELGFDDVTRYVESGYGVVVLILSFVSVGLQAKEPRPAELSPAKDATLLGVKAVQNVLAAYSSIMAFGVATPFRQDPEVGPVVAGVRGVASVTRASLQLGRALAQLTLGVVDMEGIVP
ncbi:MAG TPA: hypothetical protein VFX16_33225, partial [Pseudonocardiaceae bacterium]|nr:hypothetical protein [Pseudonocardiaceae bacterium]